MVVRDLPWRNIEQVSYARVIKGQIHLQMRRPTLTPISTLEYHNVNIYRRTVRIADNINAILAPGPNTIKQDELAKVISEQQSISRDVLLPNVGLGLGEIPSTW